MSSVCLYFQVHQPFRLRKYSFFEIGQDHHYIDEEANKLILNKIADKCYIPTNKKLLELILKHEGDFKIAFSLSGTAMEQFELYRPDVLESYKELAETGCVEFLSETYYHSLSYLYSKDEFKRQILLHKEKIKKHFGITPSVFRNTELIYDNELSTLITELGYKGIVAEGTPNMITGGNPNYLFHPPKNKDIAVLLRNFKLSDDIAFRFSDPNWVEYPVTAQKYASWLYRDTTAEVFNIFIDYETFGEHQWEDTGIFKFLDELPGEILKYKTLNFTMPSELCENIIPTREFNARYTTSWADTEKDLSAWRSNAMQYEAFDRIYDLEKKVKRSRDPELLKLWSKLQTSDHFYYMCTKRRSDGEVHAYFSPYDSPYDAYIYYMNILSDLELLINRRLI